jgi:hypothetical protein
MANSYLSWRFLGCSATKGLLELSFLDVRRFHVIMALGLCSLPCAVDNYTKPFSKATLKASGGARCGAESLHSISIFELK